MNRHDLVPAALAGASLALLAAPAHAYIGPGVGLGVVGTVFGIVATVALALFGFLWYPAKRLLAKRRGAAGAEQRAADPAERPTEAVTPTAERAPAAGEAEREQA